MQSWFLRLIILAITAFHLLGCAERHRDADAGRTPDEIERMLEDLRPTQAAQGGGLSQALAMKDDSATSVYFAESYKDGQGFGPMGPVEAVAPINFQELGLDIYRDQITTIRVFFLDQIDSDGRHNHALVIRITTPERNDQNPVILALANDGSNGDLESEVDEDGFFTVEFSVGNGTRLILESENTVDGELDKIIQLRLSIDNGVEEPYSIGQISSLEGFLGD